MLGRLFRSGDHPSGGFARSLQFPDSAFRSSLPAATGPTVFTSSVANSPPSLPRSSGGAAGTPTDLARGLRAPWAPGALGEGGGGLWAGWGCKLQCPRGHLESVSPSRRPNTLLARHSATKRFLHPEVPSVLRRAPCRCRTPGPCPQSAEGNPLRLPHQGERKPCILRSPRRAMGRSSRQGQASGAPHLFASHHRPLGGMDGDFAMTSTDPQELACY